MDMQSAISLLRDLKPRQRIVVYTASDGVQVTATHTAKFSPEDFAVGLCIPGRDEFYPTHVRLLIDLHIKKESNEVGLVTLFHAMEEVCIGDDPLSVLQPLQNVHFPMQLDSAEVNLCYAQLLMIEQDFNFGPGGTKKSKFDPPRTFLMGFIRWVASGDNQIDRVITAAVRNYPPPAKYTKLSC